MLTGLALLGSQIGIGQIAARDSLKGWTPNEHQEFLDLQSRLHIRPNSQRSNDDTNDLFAMQTRLQALDELRAQRQQKAASRNLQLRIVGGVLITIGIATHFLTQPSP